MIKNQISCICIIPRGVGGRMVSSVWQKGSLIICGSVWTDMGDWGFSGETHAAMEMISTGLGFELLRVSLETCRSLCSSRTADSSSGLHSLWSRSTTLFMRSFFRPLLLLPILESRRRSSVTRKDSSITCRTDELLTNITEGLHYHLRYIYDEQSNFHYNS